jgi:hypothetical protein
MNAKSITRQHRRERLAEKVFRYQESLRAAVAAIDHYDQLKRCSGPR